MFKKISSLILVIVMLVTLLPNVYAEDKKINPYEGISLGEDISGAKGTAYQVVNGAIGYLGPNQHFWYNNVDFGERGPMKAELVVNANKTYGTGTAIFRLDAADGPIFAQLHLPDVFADVTASTYKTVELELLMEITGVHTVYMFTAGNATYRALNFYEIPDPDLVFTVYDESKYAFSDIADSKYCYDINLVSGLGFELAGEDATVVDPDGYMPRGKFADLLLGLVDVDDVKEKRAFSDVDESHPYYDSINKVAALGYMRGVGDGKF